MKYCLLLYVFIAAYNIASAVNVPQSSKFDNRIQYVNYNSGDVVVIQASAGVGLRLVFAPNETILDVASGFTQGWEFLERRNILYIKAKSIAGDQDQSSLVPETGKWDTNLMVTTNLRLYDFDLRFHSGPSDNGKASVRLPYRIEFRYPVEQQLAIKALAAKHRIQDKLNTMPKPRNWNYSMQIGNDSENIAPTMVFDDGTFTYLKFPNNRDFPSAFLVAADKTESLVNSHIDPVKPDILVIHRIAKEIVLRLGNAVVGVYNDNFDQSSISSNQGTTIQDVNRVLRSEENNS